jgi:hypothetical protein
MRLVHSLPAILGLVAACSPLDAPEQIKGAWGGPAALLVASPDTIRLSLSCSRWLFAAPVTVAADGRFAMDGVGAGSLGGGAVDTLEPNPIHATGTIRDRTMNLSLYTGPNTLNPPSPYNFTLELGNTSIMLPAICRT